MRSRRRSGSGCSDGLQLACRQYPKRKRAGRQPAEIDVAVGHALSEQLPDRFPMTVAAKKKPNHSDSVVALTDVSIVIHKVDPEELRLLVHCPKHHSEDARKALHTSPRSGRG